MEAEMTTDDVFPLLKLPAGVERVLLPFVACGTGGIQSLLNLREVCSTTKTWVDTLPPRQGNVLSAKAQVRMDSDVDIIKRFLESPPTSAVSGLSLDINAILDKNSSAEEQELWNRFSDFWTPRLETLELRNEPEDDHNEDSDSITKDSDGDNDNEDSENDNDDNEDSENDNDDNEDSDNDNDDNDSDDNDIGGILNDNRRILDLVESPNLQVLRLASISIPWNSSTVFPSSLYKVKELSINVSGPYDDNGEMNRFYSELEKNPNLRKLEIFISNAVEFECFQNYIEAKQNDGGLVMILHLELTFLSEEEKCLKFAESVVASKSTVRLQQVSGYNLEHWNVLLPRHIALEMFEKIESVEIWLPSEVTLSLLEDLPRLKEVKVETRCGLAVGRLNELSFPPSLETLSFTKGFPAIRNLPVALRSLTLEDFSCDVTELVNSLNLLKTQCAGLETLSVTWTCETSKRPAVDIENSPGFAKLRSLTFKCDVFKKEVEIWRAVQRVFQVETLQLHHLALRFRWKGQDDRSLPLLDAPFLTGLCEGPVRNSLWMVDMEKECVTPDGLPLLERLTSLAAANAKSREEREGRGRWQRQWETIEKPQPPMKLRIGRRY